jgi:iron complex transport system permease protein
MGSVGIPFEVFLNYLYFQIPDSDVYHNIIVNSRLPQAITAVIIGTSLSVAGLLMQTLFRNPLAGPGILGVSSGASLGVAVFTMAGGISLSSFIGFFWAEMNLLIAAGIGSLLTLLLILLFSNYLKNNVSLLIVGIMIGYLSSALIGFLQFASQQQQLKTFVLWGLGSFANVSIKQLPLLSAMAASGVFVAFLFIKPLNLLLLGDNYASNLGINIKRTRFYLDHHFRIVNRCLHRLCGANSIHWSCGASFE